MWYNFKFIDMQIFEYLFGIFSEILMWKIILLDYWGLLKLLRNFGIVAFICIMVGYVKKIVKSV